MNIYYDICVPFGKDCNTAYSLHKTKKRYISLPFDWTQGNFRNFIKIINHRKNGIDLGEIDEKTQMFSKYKIRMPHEFRIGLIENFKNYLKDYNTDYKLDYYKTDFVIKDLKILIRTKFEKRLDRLIKILDNSKIKVLFVINFGYNKFKNITAANTIINSYHNHLNKYKCQYNILTFNLYNKNIIDLKNKWINFKINDFENMKQIVSNINILNKIVENDNIIINNVLSNSNKILDLLIDSENDLIENRIFEIDLIEILKKTCKLKDKKDFEDICKFFNIIQNNVYNRILFYNKIRKKISELQNSYVKKLNK